MLLEKKSYNTNSDVQMPCYLTWNLTIAPVSQAIVLSRIVIEKEFFSHDVYYR